MPIRCALLATEMTLPPGPIFKCPTTPYKFHYHGTDRSQPYRPLVAGRICRHRHQTPAAARECTVANA